MPWFYLVSGLWLVALFVGVVGGGFGVIILWLNTDELVFCWFVWLRLGFGPFRGSMFLSAAFIGGGCLDINGEFDPGSGRTLAACLTHASRTVIIKLAWFDQWRTGE
jgi:hypothetical protein